MLQKIRVLCIVFLIVVTMVITIMLVSAIDTNDAVCTTAQQVVIYNRDTGTHTTITECSK